MQEAGTEKIVQLTAAIVSAYVSNNALPLTDIATLMTTVHAVVAKLSGIAPESAPEEPLRPAVPIKKSISENYLVCLEDGRRFKSLKRHLRVRYNMTPEQYRNKWRLAADYPMVAPGYAEIRSRMAKDMGLGQRRRGRRKKTPA